MLGTEITTRNMKMIKSCPMLKGVNNLAREVDTT